MRRHQSKFQHGTLNGLFSLNTKARGFLQLLRSASKVDTRGQLISKKKEKNSRNTCEQKA